MAKEKISLTEDLCSRLEVLLDALAEHPLDVVRVNIWKIYKIIVNLKIQNFEKYRTGYETTTLVECFNLNV